MVKAKWAFAAQNPKQISVAAGMNWVFASFLVNVNVFSSVWFEIKLNLFMFTVVDVKSGFNFMTVMRYFSSKPFSSFPV